MNSRIIKVVYFDEIAAADYLDISNGGKKTEELSKSKNTSTNANTGVKIEAKTGIAFDILSAIIRTKGSAAINGDISRLSESALKTTITKTILNDYIIEASKDNSIRVLTDCTVQAFPNSISFFKMYTPYLKMLKIENEGVDFSKMDETLIDSKGYYEMIKMNRLDEVEFILRFNLTSFNNNYRLSDLTQMQLNYFVVKVGQTIPSSMNIEKEFDLDKKKSTLTSEILKGDEDPKQKLVPIYDVVLAGIPAYE